MMYFGRVGNGPAFLYGNQRNRGSGGYLFPSEKICNCHDRNACCSGGVVQEGAEMNERSFPIPPDSR